MVEPIKPWPPHDGYLEAEINMRRKRRGSSLMGVNPPRPPRIRGRKSAKQIHDEEEFVKTFVRRYGHPEHPDYNYRDSDVFKKDASDFMRIENPEKFFNSCKNCKHRKGSIKFPRSTQCLASKTTKKHFDAFEGYKEEVKYERCIDVRGGSWIRPNPICDKFEQRFSLARVIIEAFTEKSKDKVMFTATATTIEEDNYVRSYPNQPDEEAESLAETDENKEKNPSWLQRIMNPSSYK